MNWILSTPKWELEQQIKRAYRYYKVRSHDCHRIAERVKNRKVLGTIFAFPEEIAKYDKYARELREVEEYIAVRQKELNKKNPRLKKENYQFNQQQIERLRNELTISPN